MNHTQSFYKRNERTAFKQIEDVLLVISLDDSMVHRFNSTGAFIWNALEQAQTSDDLVAKLVESFDGADYELTHAQVEYFLDQLLKRKIVEKLENFIC